MDVLNLSMRAQSSAYWLRAVSWSLVSMAALVPWAAKVNAHEPAEEFVKQLQARGLEDLALEYLQRLENQSTASPDFRQRLDYHQGTALIQAAIRHRNPDQKQVLLDRAQGEFDQFIRTHGDDMLAVAAKAKLADIQLERARLLLAQAAALNDSTDRRETLRRDARKLFDQAADQYRQNIADLRTRLQDLPKSISPDKDAALFAERNQLRADYVQANFVNAMVLYEQAQSYEAEAEARRELLEQANKAFATVAQKYRDRVAGISATLFQGRCLQQLGEIRKALAVYEDLLSKVENEPVLRTVAIQALRGAMECDMDKEINQWEAARQRAENWLEQQRPTEAAEDDWLAVKYLLAVTYDHLAGLEDYSRERTELLTGARKLAIEVAKYRCEWQESAQQLLADLGMSKAVVAAPDTIHSLIDAIATIREQMSQRQLAAQTVDMLTAAMAAQGDAAANEGMPERLAAAKEQVAELENRLANLMTQARDLVDEDTAVEQVNQLRYYDCTLHYFRGDFYAAAVLADFLSSRYPSTEEGRRATAVLLASLVQIYGTGESPSAASLRQRMTQSAERIAQQWKGQAEADDALATLVSLAVADGDAQRAMEYLERMSESSAKRAAAELAAGQALWNAANAQHASGENVDQAKATLDRAVELIERGAQRSAASGLTASTLSGVLLSVQHRLNGGQAAEALKLLEDPTVGPLTLIQNQHPLVASPDLQQRIYMLAILACVGSLPDATQPQPLLDKALQILDHLQMLGERDPETRGRMATAYVMLARNLQTQLQEALPARRGALVNAFQQFLERAATATQDLSVLSWVAESYLNLGRALQEDPSGPKPEAKVYFDRAVATYEDLLKRIDAGQFAPTPADRLLFQSRLSSAYGEAGDFGAAIEGFATILSQANSQVALQLEAADILQRWGEAGNRNAFMKAILGDRPDPKTRRNLIWGYGRIAKATAGRAAFDEIFYHSRLQIAKCRFQYAVQLGSTERTDALKQAEQDIVMTAKLYPRLGGPQMKAEYRRVLREIQQTLGKSPTELP